MQAELNAIVPLEPLFAYIERQQEDLIREIIQICEIPAPTFEEGRRAAFVAERMRALGLQQVEIDEIDNVTGILEGNRAGPTLLLNAHLDTVFPAGTDTTVTRKGGKLHAPGIGDNSTNLGALLFLARLLRENAVPFPGRLIFAANVGEEGLGDLRGIKRLMTTWAGKVDRVLVVDGKLGNIVNAGVGSRRYRIEVEAEGGHSWGDFGASSAIHALGEIISRIARLSVPAEPRTTYNVGKIWGGTSVNSIAEEAGGLLDMRSVSPEALARLEERVLQICDAVEKEFRVTVTRELVGDRPAASNQSNAGMVRLVRTIHQELGIPSDIKPSSTDANVPIAQQIPAVTIGTYRGENGHRLEEFIYEDSLPLGMKQLLTVVLALQYFPPETS
ncbi:MAG: M20/M25/M40 family metallo-hydrolase [Nitrospinota bacterium]|nr:MAG: M20/M25/M40 family metallo-hydrolase [Nitrospinota bacterium]